MPGRAAPPRPSPAVRPGARRRGVEVPVAAIRGCRGRPSPTGRPSVVEQLRKTLDGQVIEQAKGVLAYRHTVAVDDAFFILRRHARATGAGLVKVAGNVVLRRLEI